MPAFVLHHWQNRLLFHPRHVIRQVIPDTVLHSCGGTSRIEGVEWLRSSVQESGIKRRMHFNWLCCWRKINTVIYTEMHVWSLWPTTLHWSMWKGTFYLICRQSAPVIPILWFLEMVYRVWGYLHTQPEHIHLSHGDEINFSPFKWAQRFLEGVFNLGIYGRPISFIQIYLISCHIRHHPSLCNQLT